MLKEGIMEPSQSPWRAQILVVSPENHKKRLVVDYSQTINRFTLLDAYPHYYYYCCCCCYIYLPNSLHDQDAIQGHFYLIFSFTLDFLQFFTRSLPKTLDEER